MKSPSQDEQLLKLWEEYKACRSPEIRNEIATRNAALVGWVIGKYFKNRNTSIYRGDASLHQEGFIALLGAVERFDQDRGTEFSTFAIKTIWGILMATLKRENGASVKAFPASYFEATDNSGPDREDDEFWEDALFGLDDQDSETLTMRFRREMSFREMAERIGGITHQGMSVRLKEAMAGIRESAVARTIAHERRTRRGPVLRNWPDAKPRVVEDLDPETEADAIIARAIEAARKVGISPSALSRKIRKAESCTRTA